MTNERRGPSTRADTGESAQRGAPSLPARLWRLLGRGAVPTLAIAALAWLVWRSWPEVAGRSWQLDARPLAVGFGLHALALLAAALLWHEIVTHVAGSHPFWRGTRAYAIGMLARRLPGGPWGQVSRVLIYRQAGYPWGLPVMSSVLELGATGVAGLLLSGALLAAQPGPLPAAGWVAGGVMAAVSLGSLHPPVLRRLLGVASRLARADLGLPRSVPPSALAIWIVTAMAGWLLGGLCLYCVVLALGASPPGLLPVVRSWVIAGTAALILLFLPSSFGLFEVGLATLLGADLPASMAIASALGMRALTTAGDVVWAVVAWQLGGTGGLGPERQRPGAR